MIYPMQENRGDQNSNKNVINV